MFSVFQDSPKSIFKRNQADFLTLSYTKPVYKDSPKFIFERNQAFLSLKRVFSFIFSYINMYEIAILSSIACTNSCKNIYKRIRCWGALRITENDIFSLLSKTLRPFISETVCRRAKRRKFYLPHPTWCSPPSSQR